VSGMRIRPATALDHGTFARLFVELDVDEPPWDQARFAAEMLATTLIAEEGEQPIGYAFFRVEGDNAHVSQIVVVREARRHGVGSALFRAIAKHARREACTSWSLNVKRRNAGASVLRALGSEDGLRVCRLENGLVCDRNGLSARPQARAE
jgi:GNAT superfamily N-acetyltransferase